MSCIYNSSSEIFRSVWVVRSIEQLEQSGSFELITLILPAVVIF